jgi:hypothetical protein
VRPLAHHRDPKEIAIMKTPRFRAELSGSTIAYTLPTYFDTITAARHWAQSYGTTADACAIFHGTSTKLVARHVRNPTTNRWYKAC